MPLDPTPLQAEASRRNGACSQGPVSDEGKARAALNATRHGLTARDLDLSDAETEVAVRLRKAALDRWAVADALEEAAVEAFVMADLKLRRIDGLEMRAMREDPEGPLLRTLHRYRGRISRELDRAERRLNDLVGSRPPQAGAGGDPLRQLADLMAATGAVAADGTGFGTAAPGPARRPVPGFAATASQAGPNEPERPAAAGAGRGLNRHERRRLAALQGRLAAGAMAR